MLFLEHVLHDVRYAVRTLGRSRAFTAAATLTLALGIGATSTIFSVVDAVLLQPLPYRDASRRVMIWSRWADFDKTWVSDAEVLDYRARCKTLSEMAAWGTGEANLTGDGEPVRIGIGQVTANVFAVLGSSAVAGRTFTADEDQEGRDKVVVIGHGLWLQRYGGDPGAVGRKLYLDGAPRTIVGVMPPSFQLPTDFGEDVAEPTQAWVPRSLDPADRGNHGLYAAATLRPGASVEAANSELAAVTTTNVRAGLYPTAMRFSAFAVPLDQEILGVARPALWVLAGAVAFLLLIACANVANLQLARAESRYREIAVRAALGGGRRRLLGQMFTESLVLAAFATAAGVLLAAGAIRVLAGTHFESFPRLASAALGARALLFAAGLGTGTTLLFGVVPALHAMRFSLADSMRQGVRAGTESNRRAGRRLLVASEMALAVMLVIGAVLMLRTLGALYRVPLGIDPANVLTARVSLPPTTYNTPEKTVLFYQKLVEGIRSLPGVRAAGVVRSLPLAATIGDWGLDVDGYAETPGHNAKGDWQVASDGAAEALRERLMKGRLFASTDTSDSTLVAVVNEAMARKYWAGRDPIGGRIRMGSNPKRPWLTVVGVVGDVRHNRLTGVVKEKFYVPHSQFHRSVGFAIPAMTVVVRTAGDPMSAVSGMRSILRALDGTVPLATVRPMTEVVGSAIATERFTGALLIAFALLALGLAAIGVYGVLAYLVARRTHEIGVRIAVGASRPDVVVLVLRGGLGLSVPGLLLGVLGALGLTRLMQNLLYQVSPTDAFTFVTVPLVLTIVALAATIIPAYRAARVDPLNALRSE